MSNEEVLAIIKNTFEYLDTTDIQNLMNITRYKKLNNKEVIIQSGKYIPEIFLILKGMVRGYYINDRGEEKNIFLRPELTFTGAPDCLFHQRPTKYTFEAILETHILILDFNQFEEIAFNTPNLAKLYTRSLQENLQTLLFRVESLIDKVPEERYLELLERSPQFFQKAFNKHIANYLGITPVSLSRIIKRQKSSNR